MAKQISDEDLELLGQLGVDTTKKKQADRTPREQRIIAGYEEIERFVEEHGRLPEHGEGHDIFERLYAVRLDRLRSSAECREVLKDIDVKRLLDIQINASSQDVNEDEPTDEKLLEALGVSTETPDDITELRHVRYSQEKVAAEEIAQRAPCKNFGIFKPLFEEVQKDLLDGFRKTLKFQDNAQVHKGDFFILDGLKVYIAEVGEKFKNNYGHTNRRLLAIFENGTESNLLLRSFQTAMNKDEASRRITNPSHGPLFSDQEEDGDQTVGYVYVLRSKSDNSFVAENRKVIHKIGITKGPVQQRIANAVKDPTYLLAEVEIVGTYKVSNIDLKKLERLLHKFFEPARLDLQFQDRFGFGVEPREWFLVSLSVVEEAIQKLIDGTLANHCYKPEEGRIV